MVLLAKNYKILSKFQVFNLRGYNSYSRCLNYKLNSLNLKKTTETSICFLNRSSSIILRELKNLKNFF